MGLFGLASAVFCCLALVHSALNAVLTGSSLHLPPALCPSTTLIIHSCTQPFKEDEAVELPCLHHRPNFEEKYGGLHHTKPLTSLDTNQQSVTMDDICYI